MFSKAEKNINVGIYIFYLRLIFIIFIPTLNTISLKIIHAKIYCKQLYFKIIFYFVFENLIF